MNTPAIPQSYCSVKIAIGDDADPHDLFNVYEMTSSGIISNLNVELVESCFDADEDGQFLDLTIPKADEELVRKHLSEVFELRVD